MKGREETHYVTTTYAIIIEVCNMLYCIVVIVLIIQHCFQLTLFTGGYTQNTFAKDLKW